MAQGIELAFSIILKKIRHEKQVSQEQLALESGLDRTYISLLERGLRQPTLKTIFLISKAFDTDPSDLVRMVKDKIDEDN